MGAPSPLLEERELSDTGAPREGLEEAAARYMHRVPHARTRQAKTGRTPRLRGKSIPIALEKKHKGMGGKVSHSTGHSAARGGPQDVSCAGAALLCPGFTTHLELPAPHWYFGILSAPELGWRIGSPGRMGTALRLAWLFSLCPF